MPELPDVVVYLECLTPRIVGQRLERVRLKSPFLLRSVAPPLPATFGRRVVGLERLGKRLVVAFEAEARRARRRGGAGRARRARPRWSGGPRRRPVRLSHRARLSPVRLTRQLTDDDIVRLHAATRSTLRDWTDRLRQETGDGWPEHVTAFRDGMAVHGRYRQPCPECATPVQRIVHGDRETNYCPRCQTNGVVLADRSLSCLLKDDWPRRVEELEMPTRR